MSPIMRAVRLREVGILAAVASTAAGAGCTSAPARPRPLLDRVIEAMGGEERLSRVHGLVWTSSGNFFQGDERIPYDAEWAFALPLRFRWTVRSHGVLFTEATDGALAWRDEGEGPVALDGAASQAVREMAADNRLSLLVTLKDEEVSVAEAGEAQVGGRPALVLAVSDRKGGLERRYYFDRESLLLVKSEGLASVPGDGEALMEIFLYDYREVGGIRYPHRSEEWLNGRKVMEDAITSLRIESREPGFFRMAEAR
jgi:zinc protease